MAVRNTVGMNVPQAWTLVTSNTAQANGNIMALWCTAAGTAVVTYADGSGPFTLTFVANQYWQSPYPIQIVATTSTGSFIAFGFGAVANG